MEDLSKGGCFSNAYARIFMLVCLINPFKQKQNFWDSSRSVTISSYRKISGGRGGPAESVHPMHVWMPIWAIILILCQNVVLPILPILPFGRGGWGGSAWFSRSYHPLPESNHLAARGGRGLRPSYHGKKKTRERLPHIIPQ